jgi:hypothetical protein
VNTQRAMSAAEVARTRGRSVPPGGWSRERCPGHCAQGPALALKEGDRRLIAACHTGCRRADIRAERRRLGVIKDQAEERLDHEALARLPGGRSPIARRLDDRYLEDKLLAGLGGKAA